MQELRWLGLLAPPPRAATGWGAMPGSAGGGHTRMERPHLQRRIPLAGVAAHHHPHPRLDKIVQRGHVAQVLWEADRSGGGQQDRVREQREVAGGGQHTRAVPASATSPEPCPASPSLPALPRLTIVNLKAR